jgi:hypothetical protein
MAAPVLFVRVVIVLCRVTYDTYCPSVIHSAIHFRVAKLLRRDPGARVLCEQLSRTRACPNAALHVALAIDQTSLLTLWAEKWLRPCYMQGSDRERTAQPRPNRM